MYRCHSGVHALFQNFSEAGLWLVFPFCCLDSSSCAVSLKFLSHHLLDFIPLDFVTFVWRPEAALCPRARRGLRGLKVQAHPSSPVRTGSGLLLPGHHLRKMCVRDFLLSAKKGAATPRLSPLRTRAGTSAGQSWQSAACRKPLFCMSSCSSAPRKN